MKKLTLFFIALVCAGIVQAQNVGIGISDPTHKLTIKSLSDSTLRLIGPLSQYGFGSRLNFGDANNAYIQEDADDQLTIYGSVRTSIMGGNVGIGTTTPGTKLEVAGQVKITGGSPGNGKVLTSDLNGLASWQPPPPPPPVNYPVVWICCNPWMTKNLDVATYRNGDVIPKVTDETEWVALTTGAYCYYNNDSTTYAATYGKLYNWYAVNDSRGLAPEGWHIPTDFEWTNLGNCLGGDAVAGGPMKEIGTTHWTTPNTGATNLSGFASLPGGWRYNSDGSFYGIGGFGYWWSSTEYNADSALRRYLSYSNDDLNRSDNNKRFGFSVRCLKD